MNIAAVVAHLSCKIGSCVHWAASYAVAADVASCFWSPPQIWLRRDSLESWQAAVAAAACSSLH